MCPLPVCWNQGRALGERHPHLCTQLPCKGDTRDSVLQMERLRPNCSVVGLGLETRAPWLYWTTLSWRPGFCSWLCR